MHKSGSYWTTGSIWMNKRTLNKSVEVTTRLISQRSLVDLGESRATRLRMCNNESNVSGDVGKEEVACIAPGVL